MASVREPREVGSLSLDVAVVGNGSAALTAALHAQRADPRLRVGLLFGAPTGHSGCSINAQGFNAAIGEDDAPALHLEDVVRAGRFVADQELAWAVAAGAPAQIEELAAACSFNREADGRLTLTAYEGQSRRRRLQSANGVGLELVRHLASLVAAAGIRQFPGLVGVDLLADDQGDIGGILALDPATGAQRTVFARSIVLATGGGVASLYPLATAPSTKSCAGLAIAWRAGLELRDMEFVQFLPMGMRASPGNQPGAAIREGVRFAGAHLRNAKGERYMARYHDDAERAPRDVVARATYEEIVATGDLASSVSLDASPIGSDVLEARFRDVIAHAEQAGFDLLTGQIPVAPTAHVGIGGIVVDIDGRTSRPGVLAAGEDAGGTHGASWQPGNGLAEAIVLGARAGHTAAAVAADRRPGAIDAGRTLHAARLLEPMDDSSGDSPATVLHELRDVMFGGACLARSAAGLAGAQASIAALADRALRRAPADAAIATGPRSAASLAIRNQLTIASVVVTAALTRTESRGVHVRTDYPAEDTGWLATVVLRGPGDGTDRDHAPDVSIRAVAATRLPPPDQGTSR